MLALLIRREQDEPVGKARAEALGLSEERRLPGAEVAVKDVAVRRVDDGRRSRGPCREPAHNSRLRRVRVNDGVVPLADEAP